MGNSLTKEYASVGLKERKSVVSDFRGVEKNHITPDAALSKAESDEQLIKHSTMANTVT